MSITNRHAVIPFVSGETAPLAGQRLAKVGYKSSKTKAAKYKSIAVSVPKIIEPLSADILQRVSKHVVAMFENAQDGIIKSLYESREGMLSEVSDDDLSIDACIAYLDAESTGGRLTKELLELWFTDNVHDNLFVTIAEKLGFLEQTPAQVETINKHVVAYKNLVSSLSGGATVLNQKQQEQVRKVLDLSGADDDVCKKLTARLAKMAEPVKVTELIDL